MTTARYSAGYGVDGGTGGAGAVTSVFGRTGAVVAVAGDYNSDQVTNASTVAGATVSDALETLAAVTYGSDDIANDSSVAGTTVSDALDALLATLGVLRGTLYGLALNYVSASTVQVEAGTCRNVDDDFDLTLASATNAVLSASGAGGLDTGSEAANTWYYVWVIGDSTATNATTTLLSLSSTEGGLTYPAGYDKARRVGAIRNNASSNIIPFYQQTRSGTTRRVAYDEQTYANQTVVSSFASTSFTNVDCSGFVPPTTNMAWLNAKGDSSSLVDAKIYMRPDGSSVTSPVTTMQMYGGDSGYAWQRLVASIFELACGSALTSVDVAVLGYDDWLFQ